MADRTEDEEREETLKQFSVYLQTQMRSRNMIAADMARQTGFASSVISTWTQGKRLPTPESLEVVSRALAIPIDELLVQAGHRPRLRVDDDPQVVELGSLFRQLPANERDYVMEFTRWRWGKGQKVQ